MNLLYKAQTIIEREALIHELSEAGIEVVTPPRDVSRQVSEASIDLSLGGYSTFFDGFSIYVPADNATEAKKVLSKFLLKAQQFQLQNDTKKSSLSPWQSFYANAGWTLVLPVIMHYFASIALFKAIRSGQKPQAYLFALALICYFISVVPFIWWIFN